MKANVMSSEKDILKSQGLPGQLTMRITEIVVELIQDNINE